MAQESKLPTQTGSREARRHPLSEWNPFETVRREIDRMFDDLWRFPFVSSPGVSPPASGMRTAGAPAVDVVEKPGEFQITAELPGIDEKNLEVKCADGVLTIKGEKSEEKEESKQDYYLSERRFGSFQRSFRIPESVDPEKIDASFKNGVLTLKLPKSPEAQKSERKIEIKAG
ncbi:MAG TPA: Hsp20/alpha crystallin family protein [Pseudolabrys sp.]|nr:Hsp20/alpha crystallin family protein [Pseudolabrys sp.]